MVAVNTQLPSTLVTAPADLERIVVHLQQQRLTVCTLYIPPKASIEYHKKLYNYLNTLPYNEHVLLIGDFNAPDIKWDIYSCVSTSSDLLCDFVVDHNLTQLVKEPTHIHNNILDLLITNNDDLINDITVHPMGDFSVHSDHYIITFSLIISQSHLKTKLHTTHEVFDYSGADWFNLNNFFFNNYIAQIEVLSDVESFWSYLKSLIMQGCNLFVPKKQLHSKV